MKKVELVKEMSNRMGMSKVQVDMLMDDIFGVFTLLLQEGKTISIPGFGKFSVTTTNARMGRNPKTGEEIEIDEKQKVNFKPSSILKNRIQKDS